MDLISVSAFEEAAYTKLPAMAYDYFVGGADDEVTVRENRAAFQRLVLRNRVLVDVSSRNLATKSSVNRSRCPFWSRRWPSRSWRTPTASSEWPAPSPGQNPS
jgi:hypothetical protein